MACNKIVNNKGWSCLHILCENKNIKGEWIEKYELNKIEGLYKISIINYLLLNSCLPIFIKEEFTNTCIIAIDTGM